MAKEEAFLPDEMGRLEIEPNPQLKKNAYEKSLTDHAYEKPFAPKNYMFQSPKCTYCVQKQKMGMINKKKTTKIIKEPVLKILKTTIAVSGTKSEILCEIKSEDRNLDSLCALVDNCNQLRISPQSKKLTEAYKERRDSNWWNKEKNIIKKRWKKSVSKSSSDANRANPSCSQQALNPPCDVTIDELASYFETLVHIPKKMCSMAEMMYI